MGSSTFKDRSRLATVGDPCPICGKPDGQGTRTKGPCRISNEYEFVDSQGNTVLCEAGSQVHCFRVFDEHVGAYRLAPNTDGKEGSLYRNPEGIYTVRDDQGQPVERGARQTRKRSAPPRPKPINRLEIPTPATDLTGKAARKSEMARELFSDSRCRMRGRALAYLEARGIDGRSMEATWPSCLVEHPSVFCAENQKQMLAMLCRVTAPDGAEVATHRIYLHPDGRIKAPMLEKTKVLLGPPSGGAVRLGSRLERDAFPGGVLVLTEGVETGMAIRQATDHAVWACISTSGLAGLVIPHELVQEGRIRTVVIAADVDASNVGTSPASGQAVERGLAGQRYAKRAMKRLREEYPGLRVMIAWPGLDGLVVHSEEAGEFVPADPGAKSVDWLDHHNELGAEDVARRFDELISLSGSGDAGPPPSEHDNQGDGDGYNGSIYYPKDPADAALMFLDEVFGSPDPTRATGATFTLVTWNDQPYRWESGRWRRYPEKVLRSVARRWARSKMTQYQETVTNSQGQTEKVWRDKPYIPTMRSLSELIGAIADETVIEVDGMGVWLESAYAPDGTATGYTMHPAKRVLDEDKIEAEGLKSPDKYLVVSNGLIDLDEMTEGRLELSPPNERLFAPAAMPHPWPESATEAVRSGTMDSWYEEHCPAWLANLEWIDDGRKNFSSLMIQHFGRAMVSDLRDAQIPLLVGSKGSGKGTTVEPVVGVFGHAAYEGATFDAMADPSQVNVILGKRLAVFPDEDVEQKTSKIGLAGVLKKLAEGGAIHMNPKHRDAGGFKNTALPVLIANRVPNLRDPGGALSARLSCFTFKKSVRGTPLEDTSIKDRVLSEVPSIMVHIIWEGLRKYLAFKSEGGRTLPKPDDHDQGIKLFDEQANVVGQFVEDCLVQWTEPIDGAQNPGEWPCIYIGTLHAIAKRWAKVNDKEEDRIGSLGMFALNLQSDLAGWGVVHKPKTLRDHHGNYIGRPSHWMGVRLRPGLLAELWPPPPGDYLAVPEGCPMYGVWPQDDLDYEKHVEVASKQTDTGDDIPF